MWGGFLRHHQLTLIFLYWSCSSSCWPSITATDLQTDAFLQAQPIHPTFSPKEVILAEIPDDESQNEGEHYVWLYDTPPWLECNYTKILKMADFGTITSPNYPKNYPRLLNCQWNLESPPGTRIEVIIFDFHTKPWHFPFFDYVIISRNGKFTDGQKLWGDQNDKTPIVMRSEGNKFGLAFVSAAYFHFRGFRLQYLVKPITALPDDLSLQKPIHLAEQCGKSFLLHNSGSENIKKNSVPSSSTAKVKSYGGQPTKAFAYPWMAALLINTRNFCGGSLIDHEHILTAAHCTDGARHISILLGSHDLKSPSGIEGLESKTRMIFNVTPSSFFQHPNYNRRTLTHDISIIKLPNPINFTDEIHPICLPNKYFLAEKFEGQKVHVSGWGKTRDGGGSISSQLKHVMVSIIPNSECRKTFKGIITGNKLCVETNNKHSPCKGDSGGPLMIRESEHFMQVGIVSFGTNSCERGKPVGFTRVTAFLDFIDQVTGRGIL